MNPQQTAEDFIQRFYQLGEGVQRAVLALLGLNRGQKRAVFDELSQEHALYQLICDQFLKRKGIKLKSFHSITRRRYNRQLLTEAIGLIVPEGTVRKVRDVLFLMTAEAVVSTTRHPPKTEEEYVTFLERIVLCVELSYPGYRMSHLLVPIAVMRLNGRLVHNVVEEE